MAFDDLMRNKILGMEVIGYIQVMEMIDTGQGIYPEDVIGQLSTLIDLLWYDPGCLGGSRSKWSRRLQFNYF